MKNSRGIIHLLPLILIGIIVLVIGGILWTSQKSITTKENRFVPGEVLVSFNEGTTYKEVKILFESLSITDYENSYWMAENRIVDDSTVLEKIDLFTAKVTPGSEDHFIERLSDSPIVNTTSKNRILELDLNK